MLVDGEMLKEYMGITDASVKWGGDHSGYETLYKYEILDAIDTCEIVLTEQGPVPSEIDKEIDPINAMLIDGDKLVKILRNLYGLAFNTPDTATKAEAEAGYIRAVMANILIKGI